MQRGARGRTPTVACCRSSAGRRAAIGALSLKSRVSWAKRVPGRLLVDRCSHHLLGLVEKVDQAPFRTKKPDQKKKKYKACRFNNHLHFCRHFIHWRVRGSRSTYILRHIPGANFLLISCWTSEQYDFWQVLDDFHFLIPKSFQHVHHFVNFSFSHSTFLFFFFFCSRSDEKRLTTT